MLALIPKYSVSLDSYLTRWGHGFHCSSLVPCPQSLMKNQRVGFESSGSFSDPSHQASTASHPGLAVAQRRQSLPFKNHASLKPTSSPALDRQPFDHPLDLSIPVSPLVIRARMFFVFKGQPDFFRMRDKLAISTDEEISGSASRKLPAPPIGVSSIFKEKTLTLYQSLIDI